MRIVFKSFVGHLGSILRSIEASLSLSWLEDRKDCSQSKMSLFLYSILKSRMFNFHLLPSSVLFKPHSYTAFSKPLFQPHLYVSHGSNKALDGNTYQYNSWKLNNIVGIWNEGSRCTFIENLYCMYLVAKNKKRKLPSWTGIGWVLSKRESFDFTETNSKPKFVICSKPWNIIRKIRNTVITYLQCRC